MIARELTQKQEAFCLAVIEGMSASDAYRRAYDASGMTPASVNRQAKATMDNPKIASRLLSLRSVASTRAEITLATHLRDLKRLRDLAEAAQKYGPAVAAEMARGKASGLYVERIGDPNGNPLQTAVPVFNITVASS